MVAGWGWYPICFKREEGHPQRGAGEGLAGGHGRARFRGMNRTWLLSRLQDVGKDFIYSCGIGIKEERLESRDSVTGSYMPF